MSFWVYVDCGMKQDDVVLYVIEKVFFLKPFYYYYFCMYFVYILDVNNILEWVR